MLLKRARCFIILDIKLINQLFDMRNNFFLTVFFIFLVFIFQVVNLSAYPTKISESKESFDLGVSVEYLEDPESEYCLRDVIHMDSSNKFTTSAKLPLNFGYSKSTYWVKFSVFGQTESKSGWVLDIPYAPLDFVTLYVPNGSGGYYRFESGDRVLMKNKPIEFRNPVFSLGDNLIPYSQYYMKVSSGGSINLPIFLWTGAGFTEYVSSSQTGMGIYYGIMFALLLYNLFLFLYIRDKDFLLCSMVIFANVLTQGTYSGMSTLFVWPDWIWWANNSLPIFSVILFMCIAIFTKSFLNLKVLAPKLNTLMKSFIIFYVFQILGYFVIGYRMTSVIAIYSSILLILSVFITAMVVYSRGYKPARFLLVGWTGFLIGLVLLLLKLIGVLPHVFITEFSVQIGFTFTAVFLSFALTDRVSILRRDKEFAQKEVLDKLRESEQLKSTFLDEAEKLVERRTRELEGANQKLVELASVDVLTGLHNRRVFNETVEIEFSRAKRSGQEISFVLLDIDYFKNYNDYYGHLEGDNCLKKMADIFKNSINRSTDVLSRYGGEEFALILCDTNLEGAEKVAEDIRYTVEEAEIPHKMSPFGYVTISCGVVSRIPTMNERIEDFINKADQALYKAKNSGRNRVVKNVS